MLKDQEMELLLVPEPVPTRERFMELWGEFCERYQIQYDESPDLGMIEDLLVRIISIRDMWWFRMQAVNHSAADRYNTTERKEAWDRFIGETFWLYKLEIHVSEQFTEMNPYSMQLGLSHLQKVLPERRVLV